MRRVLALWFAVIARGCVVLAAVALLSQSAKAQCDCPALSSCAPCSGGITSMTLLYTNSDLPLATFITVTDGGGVVFSALVLPNRTFSFTSSQAGQAFVGGQITIASTPLTTVIIETTCAVPISRGKVFGNFTVQSASSMSGKVICCEAANQETVLPVISSCPADINVSLASNACNATVSWSPPTVSDNCGIASFTHTYAPGALFPLGSTTVQYTATDNYGNTATCSFKVNVTDATAPVISNCPSDILVDAPPDGCGAVVSWSTPLVSDNCSVTMSPSHSPGTTFPIGTTLVTYTAIDAGGNRSECAFNVVVRDITSPALTQCTADVFVTTTSCDAVATWIPPAFSDACSTTVTSTNSPGDTFPIGTTLVKYTASDPSGNQTICSFNVTVVDASVPVFTQCPEATIQFNAGSACKAVATWDLPAVTDNCTVTLTSTHLPGMEFPIGPTDVIYTATDLAGNSATCKFTVLITDVTPPVISSCITSPINLLSTTQCGAVATWTSPSVSDNCSATLSSNFTSGTLFPIGTTNVVYTATDLAGNTSTCSFNVVVSDNSLPSVTSCPSNVTVNLASNACTAAVTWTPPVFSDNCLLTVTKTHSPGATFSKGTTTVTYSAKDPSGNTQTCSFTVTVKDVDAPVISGCPSNVTVNATASCNATVSWTAPQVTDNCTGSTLASSHASGISFPLGTTVVTYTATDAVGNISTCSFNVVVVDNTAPIFTSCVNDITVNATSSSCSANVSWAPPTATDNCSVILESNYAPGASFAVGTTTVTYKAKDAAGNFVLCSFNVIVKDATAPVISGCVTSPINLLSTTQCGAVATWTSPSVSDNCSATLSSSFTSGTLFPIGTTTVVYTATDLAGNTSTCSFNVVVSDNSLPSVTSCPSNVTVNLASNACTAAVTWTPPVFSDNCSLTITKTHSPGATFSKGTTTVTYTAKDPSGNTQTCSFTVTVKDVDAPVLSGCPSNVTVNATASCNATVSWTAPQVTDNCTGSTLASSHASGTSFPLGTTVVTYTATDAVGNISTCSFNVVVVDNTAPVFTSCVNDITVNATSSSCSANVSWTPPTATDNCLVILESNYAPGASFAVGTTTVTYKAKDAAGNFVLCSFKINVSDVTPPFVSACTSDVIVSADNNLCSRAVSWTPPVFSSSCGGLIVSSSHSPGDIFAIGETVVKYSAADASGNITSCDFKITVIDDLAPSITNCPTAVVLSAGSSCTAKASWTPPAVSDNCSAILSSTHQPGDEFPIGETEVSYTATDPSGNQSRCAFKVVVKDILAPVVVTGPTGIVLNSEAGSCGSKANWNPPVFTDCTPVSLTSSHHPGDFFATGKTTVKYTAIDSEGNSSDFLFDIDVIDKSAPVLIGKLANITTEVVEGCDAIVTWGTVAVTDNCGPASILWSHKSGDRFPIGSTRVSCTAIDNSGNRSTWSFDVIVKPKTPPQFLSCPGDIFITVTESGKARADWSVPEVQTQCGLESLVSSYLPGDEFSLGETLVEYLATDVNGLTSTCSFKVTLAYETLQVVAGKFITPDGDGVNDVWAVDNIEKFKDNRVTVVDRWGGLIYTAQGYDNENIAWDGRNQNGASVPTGTYFYTISVNFLGSSLEKKGFIEVIN